MTEDEFVQKIAGFSVFDDYDHYSFSFKTLRALASSITELREDCERIDKMCDGRIVDGLGGIDIDDATATAVAKKGKLGVSDVEWRAEWRIQFRKAIDAWTIEVL